MYRYSLKEFNSFQCCQKRCCHHRQMPLECRSYLSLENKTETMLPITKHRCWKLHIELNGETLVSSVTQVARQLSNVDSPISQRSLMPK